MRVALLPRLDRVQGVHEHVASGSPEAAGDHGLVESNSISIFSKRRPAHVRSAQAAALAYMYVGRAALIVVVAATDCHILGYMQCPSTKNW